MWEIKDEIDVFLKAGEFGQAISIAEGHLAKVEVTEFHKVIGRDLLHLTQNAAEFISDFYAEATNQLEVKAMYFEMNGFGINPDLWFFDPFGYSFCGTPGNANDISWLADYEFSWDYSCVITGYEDLQTACKDHLDNKRYNDPVQRDAKDFCELVITLRFIQLIAHTVKYAREHNLPWKNIPVFGTSHDEEILYQPI